MNHFITYIDEHLELISHLKTDKCLMKNLEIGLNESVKRLNSGGKLLICGNGGSAADAQHIAAELVGKFNFYREPIAAISLTANSSILTAWSNDESFDDVFARQVEALGSRKDVLIGISTSGRSKNVLNAFCAAKKLGIFCIGLTGSVDREFMRQTDVSLSVQSTLTPLIQEAHIVIYHYFCAQIEVRMMRNGRN